MSTRLNRAVAGIQLLQGRASGFCKSCAPVTTASAATQGSGDDVANARPFQEIPGPKSSPVVGSFFSTLSLIRKFGNNRFHLIDWHFHKTYGDIVALRGVPFRPDIVFLFNPVDVETVYRNEGQHPIRPGLDSLAYYRKKTSLHFFRHNAGLLVEHGKKWHDMRSKVQQPMMRPLSAKQYSGPMVEVARDFVRRISEIRNSDKEVPENFVNEIYKWALESIATVALDTRLGCLEPNLSPDSETQKMIDASNDAFSAFGDLEFGMQFWRIVKTPALRKLDKSSNYFLKIANKYIQEALHKLENMPKDDDTEQTLLQKFLSKDKDPHDAIVMALDMLMAGIDTTSHSLAFALYHLATNQEKQEKLYQEIRTTIPEDSALHERLDQLRYLRACIKESMRLLPVVNSTGRILATDVVLSGYNVPKGMMLVMVNHVISRRPDLFPEPDRFIPERWLTRHGDPEFSSLPQPPRFSSFPFSHGPRMCIGRRFAELEMQIALVQILKAFRLEYHHDEIGLLTRFVNIPDQPLRFRFIERR